MLDKKSYLFTAKRDKRLVYGYSFFEHFLELKYRLVFLFSSFFVLIVLNFSFVKFIVKFLEYSTFGIKFIQLAPNEYFFATLKVTLYASIVFLSPFIFSQLIVFFLPGCTVKEKNTISALIFLSFILFGLSLIFSFAVLVPAALRFFLLYSSEVLEPLWSFNEYFDFLLVLTLGTVLAFQFPVVQIIAGILKIISGETMLGAWKAVLILSTCLGAILTPSTDPITQLLLSSAIVALYAIGGLGVLVINSTD